MQSEHWSSHSWGLVSVRSRWQEAGYVLGTCWVRVGYVLGAECVLGAERGGVSFMPDLRNVRDFR